LADVIPARGLAPRVLYGKRLAGFVSTPTIRRDASGLKGPTRILFLTGRSPEKDAPTIEQLGALGPFVHLTTVTKSDELPGRLREGSLYHVVVLSHGLPQSETLAVIGMLRKANAPVAIVPVVTESQRDLYSSAVAVGADDVLILLGGVMVHPADTLNRAKQSRHIPPAALAPAASGSVGAPATPVGPPTGQPSPAASSPAPRQPQNAPVPGAATPAPAPVPASAPAALVPISPSSAVPAPTLIHTPPQPVASAQPRSSPSAAPTRMDVTSDPPRDPPALRASSDPHDEEARRQIRQAARPELEAALQAATSDLRRAEAAHAADRASWKRVREDLLARLADLESVAADRAAREAAREQLAQQLQQCQATFDADRAAWVSERRTFETRIAELESTVKAHVSDAGSLEAAERDLRQGREVLAAAEAETAALRTDRDERARQFESDRAEWERLREALESRLREADTQLTELRRTAESYAAERQAWEDALRNFERQTSELEAVVQARGHIEASLASARAALDDERARHEADRAAWQQEREDLDSRMRQSEEAAQQARQEADIARQRAEDLAAADRPSETHDLASDGLKAALEDALRERDRIAARHDRLLRTRIVGYGISTLDGRLVFCNDMLAELLGYGDAEGLEFAGGVTFVTDLNAEIRTAPAVPPGHVFYRDSMVRAADGRQRRVLEAAMFAPAGDDGETLIERVVIDLGDRASVEGQLRQARRLEQVGQLAAAVAPDLDPLPSLIEVCLAQLSANPSADAAGHSADALAACAAGVMPSLRQLVTFSRKQARPPQSIDLNALVERLSPTWARLVGAHMDLSVRIGHPGHLVGDEVDVEQMLTALFIAARDLLTAGGALVIETTHVTEGDAAEGGRPAVSIAAQGVGLMAAEPTPGLRAAVDRCGATLEVTGDAGRRSTMRVVFAG
jgi:hypothetical protein